MTEEQKYNKAVETLVDWVEQCKDAELCPELASTLLLDTAIDLHFYLYGTGQTMEAVDTLMREKIMEYDRCGGDAGLERN